MQFREEAKSIEQQSKAGVMEISQVQIVGEGDYVTIESIGYDGHILSLCHAAVLNAWDRIKEIGNKMESFAKVIEVPKKALEREAYRGNMELRLIYLAEKT